LFSGVVECPRLSPNHSFLDVAGIGSGLTQTILDIIDLQL
jgi:hypothetical protein